MTAESDQATTASTAAQDEITLTQMIELTREAFPGPLIFDEITAASEMLAASILDHPDRFRLVARLARPMFMAQRRRDTWRTERNAARDRREQQDAKFNEEDKDRPRWTGDDKPNSGRWRPRGEDAKDDAARARATAFLAMPISVKGEGPWAEVLWRNATVPMLRDRSAFYTSRILGLQESKLFLEDQITLIMQVAQELKLPEESLTLGEAYSRKGQ